MTRRAVATWVGLAALATCAFDGDDAAAPGDTAASPVTIRRVIHQP